MHILGGDPASRRECSLCFIEKGACTKVMLHLVVASLSERFNTSVALRVRVCVAPEYCSLDNQGIASTKPMVFLVQM